MQFSNLDYLYNNLPAQFRREDKDLFLKRFLSFFGETLDEWDETFDGFHEQIDPDTASEQFIEFWLASLFGWGWLPKWFTISEKRRLYRNFARHLARRGTKTGIERWLSDFNIVSVCHTRAQVYGEFVWGESGFAIDEPLHFVVELLFVQMPKADSLPFGEFAWGEGCFVQLEPIYDEREIFELVKFQQPVAQEIVVLWRSGGKFVREPDVFVWFEIAW